MSAHAGILYHDTRPVTSNTIEALSAWNSDRGPHRTGSYKGDGVTLLHWSLHFDRLATEERQPLTLPSGAVLTWDGRLDNRDDLLLQLHASVSRDPTDIALVGAALERWGLDACRQLIGDWSFALWQPRSRSLTLARDFVGNRPLHFIVRPQCVAYSTCLETLLAMFDLYERVNEDYLISYLVHRPLPYQTAYQDVLPVPPGHYVVLCPGEAHTARAYRTFQRDAIRYQHEADYAYHLRQLFADAVRGRLRSREPVWAELSGGLDSSAVVGMAQRLIMQRAVDAPELKPMSWVFPSSPDSDESSFIEAVESYCGVSSLRLDGGRAKSVDRCADTLRPFGNAELNYEEVSAVMAPSRGTTLLTGAMGDATMANEKHCWSQAEHLLRGDLKRFVVGCATFARRKQKPMWSMMRQALEVFIPLARRERAAHEMLIAQVARERKRRRVALSDALGVTPQTLERAEALATRLPSSLLCLPYMKRLYAFMLWQSMARDGLTTPDRVPLVRLTHPYADVRIIDFTMAVPETVRWKPEEARALMRAALGTLLPPVVRDRTTKGYFAPANHKMFRPLAATLRQEREPPRLVQLGFVDAQRWDDMLRRLLDGSFSASGQGQKLLEIEAWLRGRRSMSRARVATSRSESPHAHAYAIH